MQHLSETSLQPFLGKEWLVKVDSTSSTPYLFKLVSSTIDLTCRVLFTDTKSVWIEDLTSQQIARRWRQYNPQAARPFANLEDEDEWRTSILELLAKAHTLGGVNELLFEVVNTHYSDIAFSLECHSFSWRWETCNVGHKLSAEIISKQLVLPLISTNHLLYSSFESVQDMADTDVEKAVDKIGRTARRSFDTHIKNALSKPRISTILRRVTAMLNSLHELPSITSTVEEPRLQIPSKPAKTPDDDLSAKARCGRALSRDFEMAEWSRSRSPMRISPPLPRKLSEHPASPKAESATESSAEEDESGSPFVRPPTAPLRHATSASRSTAPPNLSSSQKRSVSPMSKSPLVGASRATSGSARAETPKQGDDKTSDDDSSPIKPPPKKVKAAQASSSESDSESERRARIAQLKGNASGSGMDGGGAKRSVRQPIKRGGKRF